MNCVICTEEECLGCLDGYYPEGLSCLECNQECAACNSKDICTYCIEEYYLTDEGKCLYNNPVEGCEERTYEQIGGVTIGSITNILTLPFKSNQILAVVTENDHIIRIWDMTTGSYMRIFEGHTTEILKLKYLDEFEYLISSGLSDIFFWDVDSGKLIK